LIHDRLKPDVDERIMHMRRITLAFILGLALAACGTAGTSTPITVQEPWARPAALMDMDDESMSGEGEMDEGEMDEGEMSEAGEGMGGMMGHGNGVNSAAYMVIANSSSAPDFVISATTDVAETVELHTVEMNDGVMQMRQVEQIEVPANGQVELKPGGFHVMLLGVQQNLNPGDTVSLTLTLQNAGDIQVEATVREP
jgi:copper(I)-binding protein